MPEFPLLYSHRDSVFIDVTIPNYYSEMFYFGVLHLYPEREQLAADEVFSVSCIVFTNPPITLALETGKTYAIILYGGIGIKNGHIGYTVDGEPYMRLLPDKLVNPY